MKAKLVNESRDEGIQWSGKDVTKAPIIGKIITKADFFGKGSFPSEEYNVVEIIDDGNIYVVNTWYKYSVPQLIHKNAVEKYIPYKTPIEQEDPDKDFRKKWGGI